MSLINFQDDRADIALERDRQQGQIRENQANEIADTHYKIIDAHQWAESDDAQTLTQVVTEMIENEVYSKRILKSQVRWDVESISEAVTEACIILGLDDERFSPTIHNQGHESEIRLF